MSAPDLLGSRKDVIAPAASARGERPGAATATDAGWGVSGLSRYWAARRRRRMFGLVFRADRARDCGDFAAAAALYRRALAQDVRRTDIRVQLAHMLKELTCFGEAEAAYRQALAQSPEDGEIRLQLGHLLKLLGRTDEAIAAYTAADRLLQDSDAAAVELRALGVLPPGEEAARAETVAAAEAHIADGDRLRDAGSYAEAAEAYARALELVPSRIGIRIQYGNMLKDCGCLDDAEGAYRAALARLPENAEIHLQLGHLFKLQGRRAEAVAAYRRAAELQPSLEAAWAELFHAGCAEGQQQRFEKQLEGGGIDALLEATGEVRRLRDAVMRLAETLPDLAAEMAFPVASYDRFRSLYDIPSPPEIGSDRSFGVVVAVEGVALEVLYRQIGSLLGQSHPNWQLAVVGRDPAQRRVVERAAASDPRIVWHEAIPDETTDAAERRIALVLTTEWLVLLTRGARLHRHALGWCAAVAGEGSAVAFVTDEDELTGGDGRAPRLVPRFRQAVDYDTLLEANPFGETMVIARAAYASLAEGLTGGSLTAARSSLLLALAARRAVGHIPLALASTDRGDDAPGARVATQTEHATAVRAHLDAAGLADRVEIAAENSDAPLRVSWHPRDPGGTIEVIVPTRDNGIDVREFVASLRQRAAAPEAVRVLIVDNGSTDRETGRILAELSAEDGVRAVRIDEPFNWSRFNNRAAALSDAELLVFANDDMVMLSEGWDRQLRGLLERPEIGAVGGRLIYPDDSVQHAGILLGWPGIAVHDGRYEPLAEPGPCRRWHVTRAVAAVTGAFLAMRRDIFAASGGFDEAGLPVAYGDIDFALKLRARGLKVLWTPSITLRHYESKSRGLDHLDAEKRARNKAERSVIEQRWGAALRVDPSVNPAWHAATLPFRLISAPSQQRLWRHIQLCAGPNPWLPDSGDATIAATAASPAARMLYPIGRGR
jgi:GT2 family glycosyltransferase/tetratricopeptide (TPR) repeat protein